MTVGNGKGSDHTPDGGGNRSSCGRTVQVRVQRDSDECPRPPPRQGRTTPTVPQVHLLFLTRVPVIDLRRFLLSSGDIQTRYWHDCRLCLEEIHGVRRVLKYEWQNKSSVFTVGPVPRPCGGWKKKLDSYSDTNIGSTRGGMEGLYTVPTYMQETEDLTTFNLTEHQDDPPIAHAHHKITPSSRVRCRGKEVVRVCGPVDSPPPPRRVSVERWGDGEANQSSCPHSTPSRDTDKGTDISPSPFHRSNRVP